MLGMTPSPDSARLCANDDGDFYECNDMLISIKNISYDSTLFVSNVHFQLLSDYTEQMAMALKKDTRTKDIEDSIVVASFVYLDDNLKTTSPLGNQLAEYFINDLQEIGLPVSDHKLTAGLNVTSQGDFSLSRNIEELNPELEIGYVLTGTMIKNERGMVVNVRLIHRESNRVFASTSKLLPNLLINDVM